MSEKLSYFIDWFPQMPVELIPGKRYRLGRGAGNEFYLPDVHASRDHAEITWNDGGFVLTDFGSSNGTFLNDEPVTDPVTLQEGDEIRVGTTVLRLRVEEAKKAAEEYENTKKQVQEWQTVVNVALGDGYHPGEHGGLSGAIKNVSIAQVIQMLTAGSSIGRLLVTATGVSESVGPSPDEKPAREDQTSGRPEDAVGSVYFKDGQVIAAGYVAGESPDDAIEGAEAVYALLALREGTFEFLVEDVAHIERTIEESPQALLMEGMRRLDERARDAQDPEDTQKL